MTGTNVKNLTIDEDVIAAENALSKATADDLVELCRTYLTRLSVFRDRLFELRGAPEIDQKNRGKLGPEMIDKARYDLRVALESVTEKRNRTEALLNSFISITGYEATATFNKLKYKGFDSWELHSGGARLKYVYGDKGLNMQETVETASLLRREAYIDNKTTFFN
jgi:hypothetical protein